MLPGNLLPPLLAVHISDGVLSWPWLTGGFLAAAFLALLGAWRIRDEEIPKVALLTAAFFVVSTLHVKVGPTSVHLLFNGLLGVVLGRRAGLGILVGLSLQAALAGHGGFTTIGINTCVMTLPALLAWQLFGGLQRLPWVRQRWFRSVLVAVSTYLWVLSLIYSAALLYTNRLDDLSQLQTAWANRLTLHPATLVSAAVLALLAAWGETRVENAREFPLGLLVGEVAVLATVLLNCLVLIWGGPDNWPTLVLVTVVPHLLIAVIEGIVLGFTVGFLVKVKPEMLHWVAPEKVECTADSVS